MKLTKCDIYVGVSSGAFVVAGLANGISPREMHAMFILDRSHSDPFEPNVLLRPAFGEFARRLMRMPELMQAAALTYFGETPGGRARFPQRFLFSRPDARTLLAKPGELGRLAHHRKRRADEALVGALVEGLAEQCDEIDLARAVPKRSGHDARCE